MRAAPTLPAKYPPGPPPAPPRRPHRRLAAGAGHPSPAQALRVPSHRKSRPAHRAPWPRSAPGPAPAVRAARRNPGAGAAPAPQGGPGGAPAGLDLKASPSRLAMGGPPRQRGNPPPWNVSGAVGGRVDPTRVRGGAPLLPAADAAGAIGDPEAVVAGGVLEIRKGGTAEARAAGRAWTSVVGDAGSHPSRIVAIRVDALGRRQVKLCPPAAPHAGARVECAHPRANRRLQPSESLLSAPGRPLRAGPLGRPARAEGCASPSQLCVGLGLQGLPSPVDAMMLSGSIAGGSVFPARATVTRSCAAAAAAIAWRRRGRAGPGPLDSGFHVPAAGSSPTSELHNLSEPKAGRCGLPAWHCATP